MYMGTRHTGFADSDACGVTGCTVVRVDTGMVVDDSRKGREVERVMAR